MNDSPEYDLVATFPDGSYLRRYIRDGQYWHEYPHGRWAAAQKLSMKRAADRVAYQGGVVILGVPAARLFYARVEKVSAERAAEIAARDDAFDD